MKPIARFERNIARIATGSALGQLVLIASTPLLARQFSPRAFSALAIFMATNALVAGVSTLKYDTAIVLPKQDLRAVNLTLATLTLSLLSSLLVIFVLIAYALWRSTTPRAHFFLLPLGIAFAAMYSSFLQLRACAAEYRYAAKIQLLIALIACIGIVHWFLPAEGVSLWAKFLILVRVLGVGGWTLSTYSDYFTEHGYTYYLHIGPVKAIVGGYPYGNLSLGQAIGVHYSGTEEANFNANFWASDGFAAMGLLGISIVTLALGAVLLAFNRAASGYPARLTAPWSVGFWMALLNTPLTTALQSGGGLRIIVSLHSARKKGAQCLSQPLAIPPSSLKNSHPENRL
ncbi:MAG: hypothetical protein KF796_18225 [Ramlibacter sp.]|nr:hypothetical protein [Ramlibacter sp.]